MSPKVVKDLSILYFRYGGDIRGKTRVIWMIDEDATMKFVLASASVPQAVAFEIIGNEQDRSAGCRPSRVNKDMKFRAHWRQATC